MAVCMCEYFPGPGEYTPNIDFAKTTVPKYSIPCSTWQFHIDIAPGPGTYNIPRHIPGPCYTMAGKKRCNPKPQGPRLPPPARGHRSNYSWFDWQPKQLSAKEQMKKVGQGIITMHHKHKNKQLAQIPTYSSVITSKNSQ